MLRTVAGGGVVFMSLLAAWPAAAADTASPNDAIAKPECDANATVSFRYSPGSARLHVESGEGSTRGGCITLTDIWEWLDGDAPLYAVDSDSGNVSDSATGTWLLKEHLWVEDGITLQVMYYSRIEVSRFAENALRAGACWSSASFCVERHNV